MAVIVISGIDYPSYASVAEADAYLVVDPLRGPAWALYSADQKATYLVAATRAMQGLSWCGAVPSTDEPVDPLVKTVCILFASAIGADPSILSGESSDDPLLRRAKAGSVEVEYFRGDAIITGPPAGFPDALWAMLKTAGMVGCTGSDVSGPFVLGGQCCSHFEHYGYGYTHNCYRCAPLTQCGCGGII